MWSGKESIRTRFVLKSIRTHFGKFELSVWSIRTHPVKFSQFVLILVNSYSVWTVRTVHVARVCVFLRFIIM